MIEIIEADLNLSAHAAALIQLLETYALDPMGGGQGLPDFVIENLATELLKRPSVHVILAFIETQPAGLLIGIEGFSSFACKPLLNIHDIVVVPIHRRRGLSQLLLAKAEEIASKLGCCKLTLEVLEKNYPAQRAYQAFGFSGFELDPQMGKALFWQKTLTPDSIPDS